MGAPAQENLRSEPSALHLWRPHADRLVYYRPTGRRPHPALSGKRALQNEGSFRTPRSAGPPHPLWAIMPKVARIPSGCRPGARPAEVCPSTCAISSGKPRIRGRQRIAALSTAQKPISDRQFAACPESSPNFPPCLSDFPLCSRIEMLIDFRAGVRAERLTASTATISTTPPPPGLIESVANDVSGTGFSSQRALPVWAPETIHCSWTCLQSS